MSKVVEIKFYGCGAKVSGNSAMEVLWPKVWKLMRTTECNLCRLLTLNDKTHTHTHRHPDSLQFGQCDCIRFGEMQKKKKEK